VSAFYTHATLIEGCIGKEEVEASETFGLPGEACWRGDVPNSVSLTKKLPVTTSVRRHISCFALALGFDLRLASNIQSLEAAIESCHQR